MATLIELNEKSEMIHSLSYGKQKKRRILGNLNFTGPYNKEFFSHRPHFGWMRKKNRRLITRLINIL